jgi:hypothetical protein
MRTLIVIALLYLAVGCSRHPEELARRIAGADVVVATNVSGASAVFSGSEAARLVTAVRTADRDAHQDQMVNSPASSFLRFVQGTNLVGEIIFDDDLLWTQEGRFVDRSGVLKGACQKINGARK